MSNFVTPNLFQLQGGHIHVSYTTTGIDGQPHFTYQDAHQTASFRGDQIISTQTPVGTLVTVPLRRTVDMGGTDFSVMIPRINLLQGHSGSVNTGGITTVTRFSIVPAFNQGQTQTYSFVSLHGTAQQVVF